MSRWHREHPDYQETGMQPPDPRDAWDMERKRQKEEGLYACATCGEPVRHYGQRCKSCAAQIEEDRLNRGE